MRSTRGFSLLELIIASMIFVIVLAAAYSLFESSRQIASRAEFRASLTQEGRTALRAIRLDLEGCWGSTSAYDTGLLGTQGGSDTAPLYKIDLVSVNHTARTVTAANVINPLNSGSTPTGEIDITRTAYYIDEESNTTQTGLVRKKTKQLLHLSGVQRDDENLEEIGPNVVYVKFRYYDDSWIDAWDSTSTGKLPKAIEVTVYVKGIYREQEEIEKFTERIYLPMAAETPVKTQ